MYQGTLDLRVPEGHEPDNSVIARLAKNNRDNWAEQHANTHTEKDHKLLRLSGRFCTPEAAQKLAALGLISLTDMVIDEEVKQALLEGESIPYKEVEGS